MKLKLSATYIIGFLSLLFVMHELHEIIHTSVGRAICGCWGIRDFNQWDICEGCIEQFPVAIIATIAGPLVSFGMMWLGALLLKKDGLSMNSLGFSLVFANMPFGRLLSALLGMGDEVYILEHFGLSENAAHIFGILLISSIIYYPLSIAYKSLPKRKKVLWFIGFLLMPLLIDIIIVLIGLNTLLSGGFLSEYWILGSPILVTIWTVFVIIILSISYRYIFNFFSKNTNKI